jgi:two-component system, cell cycle response regulator
VGKPPRTLQIVVAHSDPGARRTLQIALEDCGFSVDAAASEEEALAACRVGAPAVALMERSFAAGTRRSLLDRLKADPDVYTTAVVVIAGADLPLADAEETLRRGAHDLLIEPIIPAELVARVRAAARTKTLQEELVGQYRRLETMLHEDPLTGLFNRRYVLTRLAGLISGARRHGRPLSVAMIDIDHFKRVNDAHGHEAGDAALVNTTIAMRDRMRAEDELGRLGGEEFLALLPDAGAHAAGIVAESLRSSVESAHTRSDGLDLAVTVSVGWATWDGEEDADALVKRADQALFAAKRAGRNAVRGAENVSASLPRRI